MVASRRGTIFNDCSPPNPKPRTPQGAGLLPCPDWVGPTPTFPQPLTGMLRELERCQPSPHPLRVEQPFEQQEAP